MYLLLRLKKGKGKQVPPFDTQTSIERRKLLAHKISINGETVDYAQDELNIHDYAKFEKADELIPEFRFSIKSKGPGMLVRQKESVDEDGHSQQNDDTNNSGEVPKKTRSFQNIARQVCLMETALMKWPRRTRHHSSSSEDEKETDTDVDTVEVASVHTDISDISGTEKIDVDLTGNQPADSAVNGSSNANTDSNLSIRHRNTAVTNTDTGQSDECSIVHDNFVKHGHAIVQEKSAGKTETTSIRQSAHGNKGDKTSGNKRRKLRCPLCVVL